MVLGTNMSNYLKFKDTLTLKDYQDYVLAKSYEKLYNRSITANEEQRQTYEQNKFYNLSLKQVAINFYEKMIAILNEVTLFFDENNAKNQNIGSFFNIFYKDDRMVYVGIFMVLLAIILFFVNVSS